MSFSVFKMPTPVNISGRSSTITNSFVNSIIPLVKPTDHEVCCALEILGMDEATICCSYCGDTYTEWDHLRAIVREKKPTGYISEIQNLVPACGKCNQSKGNNEWSSWIKSDVRLSPKTRKIPTLASRIRRLETYEKWKNPTKVDFAGVVGVEMWNKHWSNMEEVHRTMRVAQELATAIKTKTNTHMRDNSV